MYEAAYPADNESEGAAAAAAAGVSFNGVLLEAVTVERVEAHGSSAKHRVAHLKTSDGRALVAVPADEEAALAAGDVVVAALNAAAHDVRGVAATAHLLVAASFSKETGRVAAFVRAERAGPVHIGRPPAEVPAVASLGAIGKHLKTLEISDGLLAFKGVVAEPKCRITVNGQIKI